MQENQIKTLSITELLGNNFYIPEYQRGYRWTKTNVLQLIQGFELIDGQQRLTTLHRIVTYLTLEYLQNNLKSEGYPDNLYSIYYKTRLESKAFLETAKLTIPNPIYTI